MLHQPGRFHTLVEVEKDAMEPVFFFLKENKTAVFIDPTTDILSRYASGEKETTIVKSLVSEAPVQTVREIQTITTEKMLVDIFVTKQFFQHSKAAKCKIFLKKHTTDTPLMKVECFAMLTKGERKRFLINT